MNLIKQVEYHLWAEKKFFEVLSKVSNEDFVKPIPGFTKTLQQIYGHKTEVIWSWFELIFTKSSKKVDWNKAPTFESMSREQITTETIQLLEKVLIYLKEIQEVDLLLDLEWIENKPYLVTNFEIIFNFLNHLTYHRGQIVFIFKKLGFITPETDYNPYLYQLQGLT
jgi:uncharacterized damage-inducible protein DinB